MTQSHLNRVAMVVLFVILTIPAWPQLTSFDKKRAEVMLSNVTSDVKKYYYDATLHGIDLEASAATAKHEIEQADSWDVAMLQIAAVFEKLNDSHTLFIPPAYPIREDYGWQFRMVGKRCYVVRVRPGSDAESKGLKPGDEVLTIDGFTPTLESLPQIKYVIYRLRPMKGLQVDLRNAKGRILRLNTIAKVRHLRVLTDLGEMTGRDAQQLRIDREEQMSLMRPRFEDLSPTAVAVKLPSFFLTDSAADDLLSKVGKREKLILDLRENSGGSEHILQQLLGGVFDHDVKIADRRMRGKSETVNTKGRHGKSFAGTLIVLVDSESSSAAELFARVIQIEKRGTVLGDLSSGRVMEAKFYDQQIGSDPIVSYGAEITVADLIMTDGKSLEHVGVTPDEIILPTAADLDEGRDPALARAAELAGAKLTPEEAGKLFPYEWKPE